MPPRDHDIHVTSRVFSHDIRGSYPQLIMLLKPLPGIRISDGIHGGFLRIIFWPFRAEWIKLLIQVRQRLADYMPFKL